MPQATKPAAPVGSPAAEGWEADLVLALTSLLTHLKRKSGDPQASARAFLLAHVDRYGPVRATDLAEHAGLDLSTISRHLRGLEDAGCIRRTPDPDDRRASLLELSDHGRDQLDRAVRARHELLARATTDWSRDDLADLTRLLHRLAHDLESL